MTPPFITGQTAFKEGSPISDNPHPEGIEEGDKYPGPWANWRDGWKFAEAIKKHQQAEKQA